MRRLLVPAALFSAVASMLAPGRATTVPLPPSGAAYAGVAAVDASWHVGASAGQYATKRPCDPTSPDECADEHVLDTFASLDPAYSSTWNVPSYGMQSRMSVRALVVQGANGERWALVKNDLYIPQDLLWRRTAQILEMEHPELEIGKTNLTMNVSHDHSSPYYSSPSWGVWAFQDVFDVRFYEYYAERQAEAVVLAAAHMHKVRMGATVVSFDKTHRHSFGPTTADDATPAGYPNSDADHDMTIVRFDNVDAPSSPQPLAVMANFSLHPEFLSGNNLISADYVAPLQRFVDSETGATLLWSQNSVGTGEPERSTYHSVHERLEFSHKEYAQAEYGARLMADAVKDGFDAIANQSVRVPFSTTFDVHVFDRFFPGPLSHPVPTVSSCRTDRALAGNPQSPIVGLPDCQGPYNNPLGKPPVGPFNPGVSTDTLEAAGIPVPENYSAPSYTGLEEDIGVHLQAVKLGDLLVTICSCEQWKDQAVNIKTRTDRTAGNEYHGFDWSKGYSYPGGTEGTFHACTQSGGMWICPSPSNSGADLAPIPDAAYQKMRAQVNNPANGWNDPAYVAWAESEPADPAQIKGNFTEDDTEANATFGYALTLPMSMANDYNGYLASYREYQRGDHYRKALTGWGPHSEDYMATRLVEAGRFMNGKPECETGDDPATCVDFGEPLDFKEIADQAHNDARALALGHIGSAGIAAFDAGLPDDGGAPAITSQPAATVQRFGAATVSWIGGSNYTDDPVVAVERQQGDGSWSPVAAQDGEVIVTIQFPAVADDVPAFMQSEVTYTWTATWEVFDSARTAATGYAGQLIASNTPLGTYRFAIAGKHRARSAPQPYAFTSSAFDVTHWTGITAGSLRAESGGSVSFGVGPRNSYSVSDIGPVVIGPIDYPDTYSSAIPFIRLNRTFVRDPADPNNASKLEWYCYPCTFRPWADTGTVASASVTIDDGAGNLSVVPATYDPSDGRWHTAAGVLGSGETAYVAAGGVVDTNGEYNGSPSGSVIG